VFSELREGFESLFTSASFTAVTEANGFIEASIGNPTKWAPNEYVMISTWVDVQGFIDYADTGWYEAHTPKGMDKFLDACWIHHYASF